MQSFSQNNEDLGICNYLEQIISQKQIKKSFNFLDIGANDGITLSNTYRITKLFPKYKGYFVEPHPEAFNRLKELHKEDKKKHKFFNYAISDTEGLLKLNINGSHLKNGDVGLLSTLNANEKEKWRDTEEWEEIEVQVKKYPFSKIKFDFINIDAEGQDENILYQINLQHTHIICIEWNSVTDRMERISKYCSDAGLQLIFKGAENIIFARL